MSSDQKINTKIDPDFINIATHFNKNTLLTKNGELVQVIRVTGLNESGKESNEISLREIIRDSIYDNLDDSNKFAFWFHTVRRKKDVRLRGSDKHSNNSLTQKIDSYWEEENNWKQQYTNELYISIVSRSSSYWNSLDSSKSFVSYFSQGFSARKEIKALKALTAELSVFTNNLLLDLESHGAKVLGITEWEGVYYSELMRFLGKIINLEERRYPVTFNDISHELSHSRIAFGNRDVQVLSNKKNNFCSILSLKEYVEVPLEMMDKILSLNFEFIITQSFDLFYNQDEIDSYKENLQILKISEDLPLEEISGLNNYEESENKSQKDFGSLQTTITIITDDYEKIETEISLALEEFGALGLIMVREDIFLEHCFWSRIPGNFSFLNRQKSIKTLQVPGFSAINSIPDGVFDGNKWGPAISVMPTILDTPYFFNFHSDSGSSCLIQGPDSNNEVDILSNFLALQSTKSDTALFFIDSSSDSSFISRCLNGKVFKFTNDKSSQQLNPISLDNNEENIAATLDLINVMTKFIKGGVTEDEITDCKEAIAASLSEKSSNFLIAYDKLRANENVYNKLRTWIKGPVSYFFSADKDIELSDYCNSFSLNDIVSNKPVLLAIFTHLINKIFDYANSKKKRCLIVIDEPITFFNNPIFADNISQLIEKAESSDCVLVFKHSNSMSLKNIDLYQSFTQYCPNKIFFPNESEEEYLDNQHALDQGEVDALKYMTLHSQKNIILKRTDIPIIIKNHISENEEIKYLISNDNIANLASEEICHENPEISTDELIEQVTEIYQEYKKSEQEKALEAIKESQKDNEDSDF